MKRTLLVIGLLASVALPSVAHAQEAEDVLVMRRAVAEPKGKTTINPSPDFKRVPLEVVDSGANTYAAKGNIGLRIQTVGCQLTSGVISTDAGLCVQGTGPAIGDIVNFPAEMDPDLLTYFVNRESYREHLPQFSAQQIEALCNGTVSIAGTTYRGSCDPKAVVNTYAWVDNLLDDPANRTTLFPGDMNPSPTADKVNLYVQGVQCKQTSTGAIVGFSECGSLKKSPANELRSIPAVFSPEFRTVHITSDAVRAVSPDMSAANLNNMCSRTVRVAGASWTMNCTAPRNPAHYVRAISRLVDPFSHYVNGSTASQFPNQDLNANRIVLTVYSTQCLDVSTGSAVPSASVADCTYLTQGANVYDHVSIPATFVPDLGSIYVRRSDLEAVLPYGGTAGSVFSSTSTVSAICASNFAGFNVNVGVPSSSKTFKLFCGEPENPEHYQRVVSEALDPSEFYPSGNLAIRDTNSNFQGTSYSFSVKSTACINVTTGANAGTKCNFKQEGANVYDLLAIPAAYVPEMRELYVKQADLSAALGTGSANYYHGPGLYKTASQICASSLDRLKIGPANNRQEWSMRCGDPVNPADIRSSATHLADPYDHFPGTDRSNQMVNSDPAATEYKFSIYRTSCVNTKTGEVLATSRCNYLPGGAKNFEIVSMPATFVAELREFYIDEAQLRAKFPSLTNIDDHSGSGTTIANACAGAKVFFWVASSGWIMRCGQPDDPRRYAYVANYLVDPTAQYPNTEYRQLNNDLSTGTFKFGVWQTKCVIKETGALPAARKCYYLTQDHAKQYDIVPIPVVYDIPTKEIRVTRAALEAALPYGAQASNYAGNYKSITQICNGELRNLKAGPVTTDAWKMVCVG